MARVTLSHNTTIIGARRALTRRKSSFALTVRNGHLYTYRKTANLQPNTAAQLNARSLLAQANVLAREDLLRPGRRDYWLRRAHASGYKTAIGCARAHFIALLKARHTASHTVSHNVSGVNVGLCRHILPKNCISSPVNHPSARPISRCLRRQKQGKMKKNIRI